MKNKTELRDYARKLRKALPLQQKSEQLAKQIINSELFINSENVLIYYPTAYEINLLSLISDNKNFYLPRVNGQELEVCPYKTGDKLIKSKFGISEPISESINPAILDLAIVPALMADKNGYRLGYGGGYYDRFLSRVNVLSICAVAQELFVDNLPKDDFDIPVKKIFIA